MDQQVFAYIANEDGVIDDTAYEMIEAGKQLDTDGTVTAIVAGSGEELNTVCKEVASSFKEVWKIDDEALDYINSEVLRGMLVRILPKNSIILMTYDHFGMDIAPGLSVKLDSAYLPDAVAFEGIKDGKLKAVREEYAGQVSTHVLCDISDGAVITIRPGAFKADESKTEQGQIVDKSAQAVEGGVLQIGRRFIKIAEAEAGDVDITKSDILVSVGRGIEDEDNIEIIFDLAEAVGGDVSCSRPIVDAKWLEKSRQVGTSGRTVKPRVYMALGISGAFQHLGGIKGAPFIVAINKNPKAPIFQMADVGIVDDILDFVPELTDKINEIKG